jgi:hypothetical protein
MIAEAGEGKRSLRMIDWRIEQEKVKNANEETTVSSWAIHHLTKKKRLRRNQRSIALMNHSKEGHTDPHRSNEQERKEEKKKSKEKPQEGSTSEGDILQSHSYGKNILSYTPFRDLIISK